LLTYYIRKKGLEQERQQQPVVDFVDSVDLVDAVDFVDPFSLFSASVYLLSDESDASNTPDRTHSIFPIPQLIVLQHDLTVSRRRS